MFIDESSHLGENARLVVIKNAGHTFNVEKSKEFFKHLKSFLVDFQPSSKQQNNNNNNNNSNLH